MSVVHVPLNPREAARIRAYATAVEQAKLPFHAALGMVIDRDGIEGNILNIEPQADHLVVTLADPVAPLTPPAGE